MEGLVRLLQHSLWGALQGAEVAARTRIPHAIVLTLLFGKDADKSSLSAF